jgi:2-polyprenyl-3-methyl-5-hydroxy-6-metoxy-1,4-benzoquinol methylase
MYFDKEEKQYKSELVMDPPIYTKLEIKSVIDKIIRTNVVDFGAGTGRLTLPLLQKGLSVMAVDISSKSLDILKKLMNKFGFKNIYVSNKIVKTEAIVGCDVLHHVDIEKYFRIFYENLPRGGR